MNNEAPARPAPHTINNWSGLQIFRASNRNSLQVLPKERVLLQFRAEAFNFANTPWFDEPNLTASSSNFGVVAPSQINDQRNVQLALKLIF
jgi:hypothetical protein